jgi:hypothetical protein
MLGYGGHPWAMRLLPFAAATRLMTAVAADGLILKCQLPEPCPDGASHAGMSVVTAVRFAVNKILTADLS